MKKRVELVQVILTAIAIMATLVLGSAATRLIGPPCEAGSVCGLFKGRFICDPAARAGDPGPARDVRAAAPQAPWNVDGIRIATEDGRRLIRGVRTTVELDPADLRLTVVAGDHTWRFLPSSSGDLTVAVERPIKGGPPDLVRPMVEPVKKRPAEPPTVSPPQKAGSPTDGMPDVSRAAVFALRLADAEDKQIEPYRTGTLAGLKITLSGYQVPRSGPGSSGEKKPGPAIGEASGMPATNSSPRVLIPSATTQRESEPPAEPDSQQVPPPPPPAVILPSGRAPLDLSIQIFLGLEGPEEELVFRIIASDGAARVRELVFPPSPAPEAFDHTVVPFMQGMLLPKDWPKKVVLYDPISYGRGLYMPWWGHEQGDAAFIVLLETPADAGVRFEHLAGGPTRADVRWLHSLGRWSYPRRVRFAFLDKGDYVALAKRYRRHVIAAGNFVSLKEKIARNPLVASLVGSPVIHTSILYHIQPDSSYFRKDDPAANDQLVTFDERIAQLRQLAARGVKRAYIHLDGWGVRGYDNLHPDILPPNAEAGGWDGLKRFADACEELGYVFAVHDQYRDYYLDAPSYDPRQTIIELDGSRPAHATWYGGKQSILCSSQAPGYVRRNFGELLRRGVRVRGAYLDVFAVVPGDECYSPEHPVTRAESLAYRAEGLDFIRSFGGVVSSEEPADWAIPHLDLVHHGPHALDPNPGQGPAIGIPIPLFSLVYHDALFLPWSLSKGAWGIPGSDLGFYYALGHAGLPYLSIEPTEEELTRVRTVAELNRRLALVELVSHEFVAGNIRVQRFTYADGTRVTFDMDADPGKGVRIER